MRSVFGARRRAERFAALLERPRATPGPGDDDLARLAAFAEELAEAPAPQARPEFVADLRARLMTEAATVLDAAPADVRDRLTVPRARTVRERRIATVVGAVAVLGAGTTMAVASQSAVPGDVLYPVKRAIENARTGVSVDDHSKGSTLLANARGRLAEAEELSRRVDRDQAGATEDATEDAAVLESTLDTFAAQATEATDLLVADYDARGEQESLQELQTFVADSFTRLDALSPSLPEPVRDALARAGDALSDIDGRLRTLCPTCADSITRTPRWLLAQAGPLLGTLLPPSDAPNPHGTSPDGTSPDGTGPDGAGPGPSPDRGAGLGTRPTPGAAAPTTAPSPGGPAAPAAPSTGADPAPDAGSTKGPVRGLVDDLTAPPPGVPTLPVLPEVLQGVGDLLDQLTAPLRGSRSVQPPSIQP